MDMSRVRVLQCSRTREHPEMNQRDHTYEPTAQSRVVVPPYPQA